MSPCPSTPGPAPVIAVAARYHVSAAAFAALLLVLAGCAQLQRNTATLQRRVHEIGCTSECRKAKEQCDDNARYQYRQCEAGYVAAQRDFRWCNAKDWDECGYPWWSCSENLYGFCTNRFNECALACRQNTMAPAPGGYD
jgi:hypothetical protein